MTRAVQPWFPTRSHHAGTLLAGAANRRHPSRRHFPYLRANAGDSGVQSLAQCALLCVHKGKPSHRPLVAGSAQRKKNAQRGSEGLYRAVRATRSINPNRSDRTHADGAGGMPILKRPFLRFPERCSDDWTGQETAIRGKQLTGDPVAGPRPQSSEKSRSWAGWKPNPLSFSRMVSRETPSQRAALA